MIWVEVGKTLIEVFTQHKENKQKQRERLAIVFEEMANLLEDTATKISQDIYPHNNCSAMLMLSAELVNALAGKIDMQQSIAINSMLQQASSLEQEYYNRKDPDTVKTLLVTAGKMKALSIIYKL